MQYNYTSIYRIIVGFIKMLIQSILMGHKFYNLTSFLLILLLVLLIKIKQW